MPELPEVQTVVNTLRKVVPGRKVERVLLARTDIVHPQGIDLIAKLAGRKVAAIDRRGKRIVFTLDTGERFYIHLGMSGRLIISDPSELAVKHTHLKLLLGDKIELQFRDPRRFGGIWWLGTTAEQDDDSMGPEPLQMRSSLLASQLARTGRPIKVALLDQQVVAGLGNIYVDEALFTAGIHPLSVARNLSSTQISTLNRAIKSTLRRALRHRGSTLRDYVDAAGNKGGFQKLHRVYARAGKPCAQCPGTIEKIVLGGRSTHFCPSCQPKRAPITAKKGG